MITTNKFAVFYANGVFIDVVETTTHREAVNAIELRNRNEYSHNFLVLETGDLQGSYIVGTLVGEPNEDHTKIIDERWFNIDEQIELEVPSRY